FFIPHSHAEGMIDVPAKDSIHANNINLRRMANDRPIWLTDLTADLKYTLDQETVSRLVGKYGIKAQKGPAGSALLFHCNIFHASPNNLSPCDRALVIICYNSVENVPVLVENPRPEFLASREVTPLIPREGGAL